MDLHGICRRTPPVFVFSDYAPHALTLNPVPHGDERLRAHLELQIDRTAHLDRRRVRSTSERRLSQRKGGMPKQTAFSNLKDFIGLAQEA